MLKFILTLQICSMAMNTCNPPLEHKVVFDDWYSCAIMGSSSSVKTFQNLGPDYVNATGTLNLLEAFRKYSALLRRLLC